MISFARIGVVVLLSALVPAPVAAQSWSSAVAEDGERAGGAITVGDQTLTIVCARSTGQSLSVILNDVPHDGEPTPSGETETLALIIALQSGATGTYPVEGFIIEADDTFVGRLESSDAVLRQFAQGMDLALVNAAGTTVFAAPMTGTGQLRREIRDACGI